MSFKFINARCDKRENNHNHIIIHGILNNQAINFAFDFIFTSDNIDIITREIFYTFHIKSFDNYNSFITAMKILTKKYSIF